MNKQQAEKLLNDTFSRAFEINQFVSFTKELFKNIKPEIRDCSQFIHTEFKEYITKVEKVGEYKNSNKTIEILTVKLARESSKERARTMQRNFVARWLGKWEKDAALVAFYDETEDWRFSFVKMEYNLTEAENGKVNVETDITPAKRYSYLVGKNEPNHTCRSQFLNLILNDEQTPSVDEIELAFGIENVTKEFFDRYKDLFLRLKESLDAIRNRDEYVKKEFSDKNIETAEFAKKLLGQIVFIYFLQKKGWLGVQKAPDGRFLQWGTGPKNFMRKLFGDRGKGEMPLVPYTNFFNNILEPLFYEALANKRPNDYYARFNCKIPFLNGGLFEAINEYNWQETNIVIDNEIIEDILSTFDEYNFTVKEDEPLEKEVAVDPEMLGKVFENLLEITDRKSKGAFYTPREIVHYMCQQSLINYLETNSNILREELEKFINLGDFALDQTIRAIEQKKKYGRTYQIDIRYVLPESIEKNYELLDNLLKGIKVVDPAVGSGAFPVGMMNEIVRARSLLSIFYGEERKIYDLKRETVENCLYGVDIMPSAVEICKLRFWLSLIVDETDITNIKPLPNLDHKIMCGNSLLEEFEGIKLFDDKLLGLVAKDNRPEINKLNLEIKNLNINIGEIVTGKKNGDIKEIKKEIAKLEKRKDKLIEKADETGRVLTLDEVGEIIIKQSQIKLNKIKSLQKQFFNEFDNDKKKRLKSEIDQIEWELIEETLKEQGNEDAVLRLADFKKNKSKPFFLWKLYFAEVFQREKPGFDIAIANPPYVKEYVNRSAFDGLRDSPYYQGKMDLWYFFACKSIDLLREKGVLAFIAQNNWVTSYGSSIMRNKVITDTKIVNLLDFGDYKIFDTADIQTMIMLFQVDKITNNYLFDFRRINEKNADFNDALDLLNRKKTKKTEFLNPSINRENCKGKTLTFSNSISEKLLNKILTQSDFKFTEKEIANGIHHHHDTVNKDRKEILGDKFKIGSGIFVINHDEKNNLNLSKKELEIIKPSYTTKEIFRYYANPNNKEWVIYTDSKFKNIYEILQYPNIKKHLDQFQEVITSDNKPYGLHRAREEYFFKGEKIIAVRKCAKPTFSYTDFDCYASATFYIIKSERISMMYLTALLNSKLMEFWLKHKGKMQGNNYQLDKEPLLGLPIKKPTAEDQKNIVELLEQILAIAKSNKYIFNEDTQSKIKRIEQSIDIIIYRLYSLTPEEIEIIENKDNN